MLDLQFSMKELYEVKIKATYDMEINGKNIEKNETIAFFDDILVSNINEVVKRTSARGGYNNLHHVFWESTEKVKFVFSQGVFSKTQFALLSNSRIFDIKSDESIAVDYRQKAESNENGIIQLDYRPANFLFCYDKETGQKINWELISNTELSIDKAYKEVILDYQFLYDNTGKYITIGENMIKGFLSIEAKTRIKDDITGQTHTGIIIIPKVRLVSDLSIQLGKQVNPQVGNFAVEGYPIGEKGNMRVIEFYLLEDDINDDEDA